MNKLNLFTVIIIVFICVFATLTVQSAGRTHQVELSKAIVSDKIKGGWAGQTIGCTYGGATEFKFCGTMIQTYVPINWNNSLVSWYYDNFPGLYDDIYMDLTFVDVFERLGVDAPVDSLAMVFAQAQYPLWHANQVGRNNILNGIMPPMSGHWLNNPHADDIDYQIEADFAGLMSPGMPNTASDISDRVGHMINYGDGWYGGVYVGAMYSLAFIYDDINIVVCEALKTIPQQSDYYKCMSDVIKWHKQFPNDWKHTWFECERKWGEDTGCPDGVFYPFNISAVINSAYVVIGLLYGDGDFYKTMDIATRCGQDSDCNPATAAGILGTMLGYNAIPDYWRAALRGVEDRDFAYTNMSLNRVYEVGFKHALKMIEINGGVVQKETVVIACQEPVAVKYEKSFADHYPVERIDMRQLITSNTIYEFNGIGVVVKLPEIHGATHDYVAQIEVRIDDKSAGVIRLPVNWQVRRHDMFWQYQLPCGKHYMRFKWINPKAGVTIKLQDMLVYSDRPKPSPHQ